MFKSSKLGRSVRTSAAARLAFVILCSAVPAQAADFIGPPRAPTTAFESRLAADKSAAMCLDAVCARSRAVNVDVDPQTAGTASGKRLVDGLGPVAVAALALFSAPVPKRTRAMAMAVSPMFALGGAGLELRAAWW